jgi:hypothetical protein
MVVMVEILAAAIEAAGLCRGGYGVMSLLPLILTSSYRVKEPPPPNDPLDVPYDLRKVWE